MHSLGRKLLLPLFAVSIGLALMVGATVTRASHFDNMYKTVNSNWNCNTSLFCQQDGTYVSWYPQSIAGSDLALVRNVLSTEFNPTALTMAETAYPVYSGLYETDIIFQKYYFWPDEVGGRAWCDDPVTSTVCDQHYVAFSAWGEPPSYALVCHETGHTVGLTHGDGAYPTQPVSTFDLGCMGQATTNLGNHNKSQINATY